MNDGEAHVVPAGDLADHSVNEDCPCGPDARPVNRDDGTVGWVYVHHPPDVREPR